MEKTDSASGELAHIRSLKRLTYFLFSSITLIVLVIGWHQLKSSHANTVGQAKISVSNLTNAIEVHAKDAIGQADTLLIGIVERAEWETVKNLDVPRMKVLFKRQVLTLPQVQGIFIYDEEGRWVVTDKDQIPPNANNKDRDYFIYHQQLPDKDARVGKVIVSRSTGQLIIPVSRRINNEDGSFAGVALITLKVEYFIHYFNRFNLGDNGTISLAYSDGTILARRPFVREVIGSSLANGVVFKDLLPQAPSGTAIFESAVDKVNRVYSYASFYRLPLVAIAGTDLKVVLAPWRAQVKFYLIVSVLILLVLLAFMFLLLRQINRSAIVEATLERLSNEDSLTGLANRRRLTEMIRIEVSRAARTHQPLSILMLDIDYFKKYNDEYGHVAGDDCIREVAKVVAGASRRDEDVAARYGGEEMVLLLPGCDEKNAFRLADSIRENILRLRISHVGNPAGYVTVSIGYYCFTPETGSEISEAGFVKLADDALYKAKNRGRNNVFPPLI